MFSNDFARYVDAFTGVLDEVVTGGEAVDAQARAGLTHVLDVVVPTLAPATGSAVYATKAEVISGAGGGIPEAMADVRYAPITGSLVYATKAEVPDVSGKANTADVTAALATKSDTSHTHTGVYQPAGSYATAADLSTGLAAKANQATTYTKTEVDTALAGRSDTSHTHTQYAPITGSTEYATKAEVTEATGGGLTQTTGDARYVLQTVFFQGVTDIGDAAYAPISGSTVYATKAELPDITGKANTTTVNTALALKADKTDTYTKTEVDTALSGKQPTGSYLVAADIAGKANTTDVTTALAGKSDTNHTHAGVYAPASTTYTKTEVDTALLSAIGSGGSGSGNTVTHLFATNPPVSMLDTTFVWGNIRTWDWLVRSNNTPLTPMWLPRLPDTGSGTRQTGLCKAFQNRTTNTYRVTVTACFNLQNWDLIGSYSGTSRCMVRWVGNVPWDNEIHAEQIVLYGSYDQPGDGTSHNWITAGGGGTHTGGYGHVGMSKVYGTQPTINVNAVLMLAPNDVFTMAYHTDLQSSTTGRYPVTGGWTTGQDGYLHRLWVSVEEV